MTEKATSEERSVFVKNMIQAVGSLGFGIGVFFDRFSGLSETVLIWMGFFFLFLGIVYVFRAHKIYKKVKLRNPKVKTINEELKDFSLQD